MLDFQRCTVSQTLAFCYATNATNAIDLRIAAFIGNVVRYWQHKLWLMWALVKSTWRYHRARPWTVDIDVRKESPDALEVPCLAASQVPQFISSLMLGIHLSLGGRIKAPSNGRGHASNPGPSCKGLPYKGLKVYKWNYNQFYLFRTLVTRTLKSPNKDPL